MLSRKRISLMKCYLFKINFVSVFLTRSWKSRCKHLDDNICLHKNHRTETAARNTICVFFSLRCFNILCRWHWHCSWALCNHEPIQTLWIINILQHDAINNLLLGTSERGCLVLRVASTGEKSYWKLLMEVPKIVSVEFISLWGRLHHPVLRSNLRPNGTIQLPAARHHWHCAPLTAR